VHASEILLDQLLLAASLLQKDMAHAFAGTALTPTRAHLLWELRRGPSTQQSLAAALEVTPRNITGLVDALEGSGFVTRAPHPTDRRAALVTLTAAGVQAMADMASDHAALAENLVADLSGDDLDRLSRDLGKVLDRLAAVVATGAIGTGS
jgi:DNA-binding MarR family transcriptional regulator